MSPNKTDVAETIRSLRGKYKHLRLRETHQQMKQEEKELEEAKLRRIPAFANRKA